MEAVKEISKPFVISIVPNPALDELKWLGLAVASDPTRFNLCRVHVDDKRAVATDGHRLHFIESTCLPAGFSITGTELAIVLELAKSYQLHELEFRGNSTYWKFWNSGSVCELTFLIVDYTFPNYDQVIPEQKMNDVELTTKDIRKVYEGTETNVDYCVVGPGHFNARYVQEALRGAPKKVRVFVGEDALSPVLFRYDDRGAVVMPVRQ